jgi:hypothetical protein
MCNRDSRNASAENVGAERRGCSCDNGASEGRSIELVVELRGDDGPASLSIWPCMEVCVVVNVGAWVQ